MARSVYARVADLRRLLPDTTLFPDSSLISLLELSAEMVESFTRQFFGPRFLDVTVDGLGKRAVEEIDRNKILGVERLSFRRVDGSFRVIEPRSFSITGSGRSIRLRSIDKNPSPPDRAFVAGSAVLGLTQMRAVPAGSPARRFPYDDHNVRIEAFFGWLDRSPKLITATSSNLVSGATQIKLTDTSGLDVDDVLLIDRKFWAIVDAVVVQSVPALPGPPLVPAIPGEVRTDPISQAVLAGAEVIRFGRVPLLVRNAVLRTALANQFLPGSAEEADVAGLGFIKKEKTDNYEIEFFNRNRGGAAESGTGDARADAILSRFRAPALSGDWA